MSKKKPYTIEFESTHNQWIVVNDQIRSHDPDANYGYYYHKTDAKKVADMLNQRVDLLTQLESMAWVVGRMLTDAGGPTAATGGWGEKSYYGGVEKRLKKAKEAIAQTKGGE